MTFGLSGAAIAGIAIGGATLISGLSQADAAESAAAAQAGSASEGIAEQRRQFNAIQTLLAPYVTAGEKAMGGLAPYAAAGAPALEQQQALLGLRGPEAERAAIERIRGGETFKALAESGEQALLSRASATGGLRGGNIQGALAQYRPQLLSSLIDQQYGRLGGLTGLGQLTTQNIASLGQAAGVRQAAAGQQTGANVAALMGQQGSALAGAELAQGRAFGAIPAGIGGGLGIYRGLGGTFGDGSVATGQALSQQYGAENVYGPGGGGTVPSTINWDTF